MTTVITTSPGFGKHGRVPDLIAARGWEFIRCADNDAQTSENRTCPPRTNSSTPKTPQPPSAPVTAAAAARARSRAAGSSACGCQDST